MAEIRLRNLAHTYESGAADPKFALQELQMTWEDGGTYALLGPSGCGKTTMLNIISGLVTPSHGQVLFGGEDVTGLSTAKRNIAQVFQFPVIYGSMTVAQNLAFPLVCRRVPSKEIRRRVEEIADLLNLSDKLGRSARRLTADEKQLISMGRGLVRNDVTAVLMDEPLTVIDPQLKFELRRKLKEINERFGLTMVYVTHDQNEAMTFAETIVVMNEGEVVQVGSAQELFERPQTTYVGYFIGSPAMNYLPCRVADGSLVVGDGALDVIRPLRQFSEDVALEVGIRPEFIKIDGEGGANSLTGDVMAVANFGNYRVVDLSVAGQKIKVKLSHEDELPSGRTNIILPAERLCLYADKHLVTP